MPRSFTPLRNKEAIIKSDLICALYKNNRSIPEISSETGVPRSTVRLTLIRAGIKLRKFNDWMSIRPDKLEKRSEKFSKLYKGRVISKDWRTKISAGRIKAADKWAKGVTLKQSGYLEITRGKNKSRRVHDVVMEEYIGRKILPNEVVHHIDGNKLNNDLSNLQLMINKEHNRLHGLINHTKRRRKQNGQFD